VRTGPAASAGLCLHVTGRGTLTGLGSRTGPHSPLTTFLALATLRRTGPRSDRFVDLSVTVVVEPIALLGRAGAPPRLLVIAVCLGRITEAAGVKPVTVCVGISLVGVPITVVVDSITGFERAGVDRWVAVVAVAVGDGEAVAVVVRDTGMTEAVSRIADLTVVGAGDAGAQVGSTAAPVDTLETGRADQDVAKVWLSGVEARLTPGVDTLRVTDVDLSPGAAAHEQHHRENGPNSLEHHPTAWWSNPITSRSQRSSRTFESVLNDVAPGHEHLGKDRSR
jgi:hypothetical protein